MKIKVGFNNVIGVLINILLVLPLVYLMDEDCTTYVAIVSIIQLFSFIFLLRKNGIKLLSFQVIFITLSDIFHFGQTWLLALGRSDLFNFTNIDLAKSIQIYNKANIFALLIQIILVGSMLIINNNYLVNIQYKPEKYQEDINLELVYKIGVVLFCISVVPNFMYYYSQVKIILAGGVYAGIREAVDYGPLMLLKVFYQPAIFMLLIGSKDKIYRARIIALFALAFEVFCMMSGNRAQQILMIVAIIFIYYRVIKKITITQVFIYCITGYVMSILMYFISKYRNFGIGNLALIKERLIDVAKNQPLIDLLSQLGSNLNIVVVTFNSIPNYNPFNMGITYLISWLAIYPNTGGLLGNIPSKYVFLNFLDTKLPLGGSYIAELYFNFGWFSLIFAILIGIFIGMVGKRIDYFILTKNWLKLSMYMVLFLKLLWWVRDYFFCWIFQFVWSSFAIWILSKVIIKENYEISEYS